MVACGEESCALRAVETAEWEVGEARPWGEEGPMSTFEYSAQDRAAGEG